MMFETSFFIGLIISFVATLYLLVFVFRPYKLKKKMVMISPLKILLPSVFLCALSLFFPVYFQDFKGAFSFPLEQIFISFILSVHNTIRLFIVDGEFTVFTQSEALQNSLFAEWYNLLGSVIFVVAPLLTFSAVLSFFENITAKRRYIFGFFKDAYVFSELNDRAMVLAQSFKEKDPKRMIVFTDVYSNDEEKTSELIERAKDIDAILFKSDISVVNFKFHSKKAKLYFFLISEGEEENVNQLISLAGSRGEDEKIGGVTKGYDYPADDIRIYFFSCQNNYDNLTNLFNPNYIKIRKINDVQSLVYRVLYDKGNDIFSSSVETENLVTNPVTGEKVKEKLISIAVVGLGLHGKEFLRTFSWACQMFPYRLEMTGYDKKKNIKEELEAFYPEMMLPPHNGDFTTVGEAHYKIDVIAEADVVDSIFENHITSKNFTYIVVALGDDDLNIQVATKLRILFERQGKKPRILTVVYNSDKYNLFVNGYSQAGSNYEIDFCGDMNTNFSEKCILQSMLEKDAFDKHMGYAKDEKFKRKEQEESLYKEALSYKKKDRKEYKRLLSERDKLIEENAKWLRDYENSFWKLDYNYRSSSASIIHSKFKKKCELPGANVSSQERTPEERELYRIVEHQRWNAYVRSEGYVYAPVRNKLAKTHHLLIPFADLPLSEQEKDD